MTWAGAKAKGPFAVLVVTGLCLISGALRAAPLGDAVALYKQRRYGEAKALLEPLAAALPPDPSACYYLALTVQKIGGPKALDSALPLLQTANKLAPENEVYLAEYAGVCLLLAGRDSSFSLALEGRGAMSRAIEQNPADLDAREGLMTFYAQAPWPLGDADKAFEQARAIAARDPRRGAAAYRTIAAIFQKDGRGERAESARREAQNLARGLPQ
jgi:tetratricopeptide (TPR) repeat protein